MIRITSQLAIDENEIELQFIRASGPAGRTSTRCRLPCSCALDVARSPSLPEDVRARLMKLAGNRLTNEGELLIEAKRHRTQERNRQDAIARLVELIRHATEKPKPRIATKPTKASKKRRLETKKQRGEVKRGRGKVED